MRTIIVPFVLTLLSCSTEPIPAPDASSVPMLELGGITCVAGFYEGQEAVHCMADCTEIRAASYGDGMAAVTIDIPNQFEHSFTRRFDERIGHVLRCFDAMTQLAPR